MKKALTLLFLLLGLLAKASDTSKFQITFPSVAMDGAQAEIIIAAEIPLNGDIVGTINSTPATFSFENGIAKHQHVFHSNETTTVSIGATKENKNVTTIPLWLSIIPPLLAIGMALIFKEVLSSLFLGIFSGTLILYIYQDGALGVFTGFISIIDKYILPELLDDGHMSIIVFSMVIGGMVTVISKNGGMLGFVNIIAKYARTAKSGQLVTWALGIVIFFDDYANTLVVGNSMRPLTDRLKISREKLAYIVDSTAAPIASIAFVTTWIGAQLGYIGDGIKSLPDLNESSYAVFLNSLQYAFYPILTIAFMLILILRNRDFGLMHKFEVASRTRKDDEPIATNSSDADEEIKSLSPDDDTPKKAYNAVIPILVLVMGTMAGIYYTGINNAELSSDMGFFKKVSSVVGAADSYISLLWASLSALMVAIALTLTQKIMSLEQTINAMLKGFKFMLNAIMILVLAWALSALTEQLSTATFITDNLIALNFSPYLIPAVTFILAGAVAFSTGSSWSTMAIVYPIMLPATWLLCSELGWDAETSLSIFYNVVSCVLAGAIFGDHCSPISDTTILSSLASSCNHINHVRTQMPYALTVAGISILVGTVPAAFGLPFYITLPLGIAICWVVISFLGKKTTPETP
ncbi:MAG: Na+/H+ antiporter NhaC family protein [bacterium]